MPKKSIPFAICYDFDGTLAPGNMQEREFIPAIGMTTNEFWDEVRTQSSKHEADNILVYMWLMLRRADNAQVQVRKSDFENYGRKISLFPGVAEWFDRIDVYGQESGVRVQHYVISSGIREMIAGTTINKHFRRVYASSFIYDHHGVATWPALALNYTTKTQYLFRINKGSLDVYDHSIINDYVPPEDRPMPFKHMVFIGDGETDVPCFRLVKDQGGHSIAVYKRGTPKTKAEKLLSEGRVNFVASANYSEGRKIDQIIKAIIDKVSVDRHLYGGW